MPWKETSVMDERIKFAGRLLSGEKMAPHPTSGTPVRQGRIDSTVRIQ
jgi:hypothetical protein